MTNTLPSIRKIKLKDFSACMRMLAGQWNLGKRQSRARGNICAWIYFFQILSCSQEVFVYEQSGQVLGYSGIEVYQFKSTARMLLFNFLHQVLFYHPKIKDKAALRAYYTVYDYIPKHLKDVHNAELSIFIVHPDFQGHGIGTKLFQHIVKRAKALHCQNLVISTDDSCNKDFYVRHKCSLTINLKVGDKGEGFENGYVFVKDLTHEV